MKNRKSILLIIIAVIEFTLILSGISYLMPKFPKEKPSVLLIDINGELMSKTIPGLYDLDGDNSSLTVSSTDIVNALQEYELDNRYKAFILEIDSNGGNWDAGLEVIQQIYRMKKPVIAVVKDQALSTGYYIAAGTKKIYANKLSHIADIGILRIEPYKDNLGKWRVCKITSVPYKSIFYDDCPGLDPRILMEDKIVLSSMHDKFVYELSVLRNKSWEEMDKYADGNLYRGTAALQYGLIDEIGDSQDAVKWLEKEFGMKLELVYLREI